MATTIEEYIELIRNTFDIPISDSYKKFPELLQDFYRSNWRKVYDLTGVDYEDYSITKNGVTIKCIDTMIYKINDVYIEFDTSYDSWCETTEWLGTHFVEPVQQTITVYKRK